MFGEKFTPEAHDEVKFKFEVSTSNAGIADDPDNNIADLLEKVARDLRDGIRSEEFNLKDINGQLVGKVSYSVESDEDDQDGDDEE